MNIEEVTRDLIGRASTWRMMSGRMEQRPARYGRVCFVQWEGQFVALTPSFT